VQREKGEKSKCIVDRQRGLVRGRFRRAGREKGGLDSCENVAFRHADDRWSGGDGDDAGAAFGIDESANSDEERSERDSEEEKKGRTPSTPRLRFEGSTASRPLRSVAVRDMSPSPISPQRWVRGCRQRRRGCAILTEDDRYRLHEGTGQWSRENEGKGRTDSASGNILQGKKTEVSEEKRERKEEDDAPAISFLAGPILFEAPMQYTTISSSASGGNDPSPPSTLLTQVASSTSMRDCLTPSFLRVRRDGSNVSGCRGE
jgi:hypothetical protein